MKGKNTNSVPLRGKIEIDIEDCKGCLYCIEACKDCLIIVSEELNSKGYYPAKFDDSKKDKCTGCTLCAVVCPEAAIEVYREEKK